MSSCDLFWAHPGRYKGEDRPVDSCDSPTGNQNLTSGFGSLGRPSTRLAEVSLSRPRSVLLTVIFTFVTAVFSLANDIYIAQNATGGNTGADCADAYALTWFNNSANWGSGSNKIGPGTTVHLCGTFNAPAGASGYLTFQGGGNSGNAVTLLFESGAVLTAPYWGTNGAIFADGLDYLTVDGGANGVVQATASGSPGSYANQPSQAYAVYFLNVSNSEIKDLTVSDIYVHTADLSDEGGQNTVGIQWSYGSSVSIDNNTCHDVRSCIIYSYEAGETSSNISIFSNTVYNINWGIIIGDGNTGATLNAPVQIYANVIHDFALWDDNANYNHHDGVYCFSTHPSSYLNACSVYNNYIYGDPGTHGNTFIFDSQNNSGMSCTGVQIFNNLLTNSSSQNFPANGLIQDWCTNTAIYNNTIVGTSSTNTASGNVCIAVNPGTGVTLENNICSTFYLGIYVASGASIATSNYNDFYNLGYLGSDNTNNYYQSLQAWQGCKSNGCPSTHDMKSVNGNPSLSASFHLSGSSSAAWESATNLSSVGIAALDSDKAGLARPPSSPPNWDIGAYYDSGSGAPPAPPTGLAAQVN
jgi:hypothetical protein